MQIIPAIMERGFPDFREKVEVLADLVRWVQVDVTDGEFVVGKSFELELIKKIEDKDQKLWDIHLMVKEPENWISKCIFVVANRVVGQVEMMTGRENFVAKAHEAGMEAGLAFDIDTKIENIPEETDVVLLMGRKAGYFPMEMNEALHERIGLVMKIKNDGKHKFAIGVDGGINLENIGGLKDAGVEIAYCTGAIFSGRVDENIVSLKDATK